MTKRIAATRSVEIVSTVLLLVLTIGALHYAREILLPVAMAVLLTFILTPLAVRLERLWLGRLLSVVIAVGLAFSVIGVVGWLAARQVGELGDQLPTYKNNLITRIHALRSGTDGKLKQAREAIEDIGEELTDVGKASEKPARSSADWLSWLRPSPKIEPADEEEQAMPVKVVALPPSPLRQIRSWLGPLVAPLSTAGIVIVLVIFMLLKREDLRNRMLQLIGTSTLYASTEAMDEAADRLSRYLRMQLLINASYGLVVAVGLMWIGVPNALLWGVLGTLLRFAPYIGPWLAAAMPIALSLAALPGWFQPVCTVALFLVLELVVNNVLEPWLYGSSSGVSSLGVIFAAIFWTWLWGPIGLVLAMPVTVCIVVLGKYVPQLGFLPVLLGDLSALTPYEQMYQRLLEGDRREARKLADVYLKSTTWIGLYDDLLIPALHLAERDRHAGVLNSRRETMVIETVSALIEELDSQALLADDAGEVAGEEDGGKDVSARPPTRVFCIPVRDQADETAAIMLGQALTRAGCTIDVGSLDLLVSETVERVEKSQSNIAVVVVLPPLGSRNGRYLCKRLRRRHPQLAIVAAVLDGSHLKNTRQRLIEAGANGVTNSLQETVRSVRALALHPASARHG